MPAQQHAPITLRDAYCPRTSTLDRSIMHGEMIPCRNVFQCHLGNRKIGTALLLVHDLLTQNL